MTIVIKEFNIKNVPRKYNEEFIVKGITIGITSQKTGFGVKRLLVCPCCESRRTKLYLYEGYMYCRSCLPFDIYRDRRNMYDEGGIRLIMWHMKKLMHSIGIDDIRYPFHYWRYTGSSPPYMRKDKFITTLKKVQMLENMRFCYILTNKQFTASDIKKYTSEDYINRYSLEYIDERLLFTNKTEVEQCFKKLLRE